MINIACDVRVTTNIEKADSIQVSGDGDVTAEDDKESSSSDIMPDVFQSEKAEMVLEKLHVAGLLTACYTPVVSLSLTDKVVLAGMISQTVWNGCNRWKPFQDYWNIKNMSTLYSQAMNQQKTNALIDRINKALK